MTRVGPEVFRDAHKSNLPLFPHPQEDREQDVTSVSVLMGLNPMCMVNIDVIRAHFFQAQLKGLSHLRLWLWMVRGNGSFLGGNDDLIS